jgi:hypothetical protein
MKNVGFYGHSSCAYRAEDSFLDILSNRLNFKIKNIGVRQGSEERVLFELKKTKGLDLAIIFHCPHDQIFLPGCDRDFAVGNNFEKKVRFIWRQNKISENKTPNWADYDSEKQEILNKMMDKWSERPLEELTKSQEFHLAHHKLFMTKFETPEIFIEAIKTYRKYFEEPDLIMNRFYGALIQIDQYLAFKNIKAVHIVGNNITLPPWFKFQSGIVEDAIPNMLDTYAVEDNFFVNNINKEGNLLVADQLEKTIKEHNLLGD